MNICRAIAIHSALQRRKYDLANEGQCTYHAYVLCKIAGFKPGARERMENEIRVLSERIDRINRRGLRLLRKHRGP